MEDFTLRLNIGDPEDPSLTLEALVAQAKRIRASLGLQCVNFDYLGVGYAVTRNAVIQTIRSTTYSVLPPEAIAAQEGLTKPSA